MVPWPIDECLDVCKASVDSHLAEIGYSPQLRVVPDKQADCRSRGMRRSKFSQNKSAFLGGVADAINFERLLGIRFVDKYGDVDAAQGRLFSRMRRGGNCPCGHNDRERTN